MKSKFLTAALVAAGLLLTTSRASANLILIGGEINPAPVNAFGPTAAQNTGGANLVFENGPKGQSAVAFLIVFNADGTSSVYQDKSVPVYDGVEDTLIGALNNSSSSVANTHLTSTMLAFAFDGDGIDTYLSGVGNKTDTTGYGGPIGFFTGVAANLMSGNVNFVGGLASGASTYFSLEEDLSSGTLIVGSAPEPASIVMYGTALVLCAGYRKLRRRKLAVA
jgi:hypothetical protein